jgi:hypothetical protein
MEVSDMGNLITDRIMLENDEHLCKRKISGHEMIIHCHHYNARMQGMIESANLIDGKEIIRSAAEEVFVAIFNSIFEENDSIEFKWSLVSYLYSYFGYGRIDCSHVEKGFFNSDSSHFVEGWVTGFEKRTTNVCTFTEGFLQAAYFSIVGLAVSVREVHCMIHSSSACRFEISNVKQAPKWVAKKTLADVGLRAGLAALKSPNVEEDKISEAMKNMPFVGNQSGLIPLFNVYLASVPADFYNLISIRFIEAMEKYEMGEAAKRLLVCGGEICALHTFRGVMNSAEWDGLIAPMIKTSGDELFALMAVTRGLGWGDWQVKAFKENEYLELESFNGYEATGYKEWRGSTSSPKCFMLQGVSAGLMELLYSDGGSLDDKFGTYLSQEASCLCCDDASCRFQVARVLPL